MADSLVFARDDEAFIFGSLAIVVTTESTLRNVFLCIEEDQARCPRCSRPSHNNTQCMGPVVKSRLRTRAVAIIEPEPETKRRNQCGNCSQPGHNKCVYQGVKISVKLQRKRSQQAIAARIRT